MGEYQTLNRPFFAPPGFVFPIVWTLLYLLMGISFYLIFTHSNPRKEQALAIYYIQLAVNFLWPILFFNLHLYFLSFLWILLLIYLVILMIKSFSAISPLAARLQIPYLLWLVFAACLNLGFLVLNK